MRAILTIGVAGCGKSTWADTQSNFKVINLDDCRFAVCGDAGNHSATADAVVLRDSLIKKSAQDGQDIIISDTNLNETHRNNLVTFLSDLGYLVENVVFITPFEICSNRNNNRQRKVPEDIMQKMQNLLDNQKISANQIVNESGESFSSEIILELVKFMTGLDTEKLDGLISSGQLTDPGKSLWSFVSKNYNLQNFNPQCFINENLKTVILNNKVDLEKLSTLSGIRTEFLEQVGADDLSLYDGEDVLKSPILYNRITSNLEKLINL